jgi:hypothetical protein
MRANPFATARMKYDDAHLRVTLFYAKRGNIVITNKEAPMTAKPRKRRPGGGRKPQGGIRGKAEHFSTRITTETREALEREASASGQSISQVAERLLILGLREKRKGWANRSARALCFLIERIAEQASPLEESLFRGVEKYASPSELADLRRHADEWRTDPFRYRAFKIAVGMLLDALEPKGEMRSPMPAEFVDRMAAADRSLLRNFPALVAILKSNGESPENFAAFIFSNTWRQLNQPRKPEKGRDLLTLISEAWGNLPVDSVRGAIQEDFYGMTEARVDLNLDSNGEDR